jgi:hypothetical protein
MVMVDRYVNVTAHDVVNVIHAPVLPAQPALPSHEAQQAAAPAMQQTFTLEQMQTMAQLAASAALAALKNIEPVGEPRPQVPSLALVRPQAPGVLPEDPLPLRRSA